MILYFLLVRRQTLSSGHRRINGDVAGGVFGMDCSVYTFSSGSNGWLGMVPRSGKGTRSVARTKGASIPFLSKKIDM